MKTRRSRLLGMYKRQAIRRYQLSEYIYRCFLLPFPIFSITLLIFFTPKLLTATAMPSKRCKQSKTPGGAPLSSPGCHHRHLLQTFIGSLRSLAPVWRRLGVTMVFGMFASQLLRVIYFYILFAVLLSCFHIHSTAIVERSASLYTPVHNNSGLHSQKSPPLSALLPLLSHSLLRSQQCLRRSTPRLVRQGAARGGDAIANPPTTSRRRKRLRLRRRPQPPQLRRPRRLQVLRPRPPRTPALPQPARPQVPPATSDLPRRRRRRSARRSRPSNAVPMRPVPDRRA